ncbi:large ribosomal subunit protein uL10m-like [Diadema setosum]|uniref:large ribosomal subunit protein uL10m-like n=1 Tax=Diadema setosum TaxID=31175 RepID=UPI003B3B133E
MATFLRRAVTAYVWTPSTVCVRTMKSVNTRKKKPMHIMRAKLMALTEHRAKKDPRSVAEQCGMTSRIKPAAVEQPHLMEEFYARLVRRVFESSKLIAVFQNDGISTEQQNDIKRRLRKHNISYKLYNNKIACQAISGTRLENMHPLFVGSCIVAVSEEPTVKELLKATKRFPQIHLLGGLVEDQLLSPQGMEEYAKLPSLDVLRGQLAGLLTSSVSRTYSLLQTNQQQLAASLDQLAQRGGESEEGSAEEGR